MRAKQRVKIECEEVRPGTWSAKALVRGEPLVTSIAPSRRSALSLILTTIKYILGNPLHPKFDNVSRVFDP